MMHLQLRVPDDRIGDVLTLLRDEESVTNLAVLNDAYIKPEGTLVVCDVAREGANAVISRLRRMRLQHDGSIMMTEPEAVLSDAAGDAERATPGRPDDGLVWDAVEARVRADSEMSFAYLAFLTLAVLLAGAGRLLDQPILIVGAMVVGPEFSPVAAICVGLARPRLGIVPVGLRTLVLGYVIAILTAVPFWWVVHLLGQAPEHQVAGGQLTAFIVQPNAWSFVIALLAGIAGTLALTTAKSGILVGVFISVTTVPGAGTAALCIGTGVWQDVMPALIQLVVNLVGMILAGTVTLLAQRSYWRRAGGTTAHHVHR